MALDIHKPLKKLLPYLLKAQEENLNEADTIQRLVKVLEEVLGYDAMTEITRETQIKDKYCDIAIKTDGAIRFLVEAKAAGVILRDRHIEQAERYASESNIPWVVLTNGTHWLLYHLSFEEGIEYERAFSLDLSSDSVDTAAEFFGLLHRQAIRSRALDSFWERRVALSPESIGRALFTEDVLRLIRRSIRKYEGILIDPEDLAKSIHDMLSPEARERIGPVRIRRRRKAKSTTQTQEPSNRAGTDAAKGNGEGSYQA